MITPPGEFRVDCLAGMTAVELATKYEVSERTVFSWKANLRIQGKLPAAGTPMTELFEFEEKDNNANALSLSPRIKTLEQLIEVCEIDLSVWDIIDSGFKTWDVGAKLKEGSLKWKDGKIVDGQLTYKGIGVQDLWSVWARCRLKKMTPVTATIHPVECPVTYKADPLDWISVQSSLIWTDPQVGYRWDPKTRRLVPFHDREVLDLWLQIAQYLQPERMDILGDWFDATGWTDHFLTDPNSDKTTQPSILESHWWLRQFREKCPNTKITIHPGNHDARIINAIKKHLPVAYQLHPADELELPPSLHPARLLALHQLDIEWLPDYPNDEDWLGESIRLNHGHLSRAGRGNTTKAINEANDVATITGHGHRSEHTSRTRRYKDRIETQSAYAVGCTCRIDGEVPSKHQYMDWQQSAALVHFTNNHHSFQILPVSTTSPKEVIIDGRLYTARDRISDLTHNLPNYPW